MKKHVTGNKYRIDDYVISAIDEVFTKRMKNSSWIGSQSCNTDGEIMLRNKASFVHCLNFSSEPRTLLQAVCYDSCFSNNNNNMHESYKE